MPTKKHAAFNARYETEVTPNGCRYTFFCGLSGAAVYTTDPICAADEDAALDIAKREAKRYFNFCWECGVWIGDSAYNIDEMKCVICAPFTTPPNYCAECGSPIKSGSNKCRRCGFPVAARASG